MGIGPLAKPPCICSYLIGDVIFGGVPGQLDYMRGLLTTTRVMSLRMCSGLRPDHR